MAAHLTAVARAIRILRPAALADIPSSRAATNRWRKSEEYGFPIHADPLHGSQYESEIAPDVNPKDSTWSRSTLGLADQGGGTDTLMIDATHLKTHRTASSLGLKKGGVAA